MATTILKIRGMSCGHCVNTVQAALEAVEGVGGAEVDLRHGRATVEYDDAATSPRALVAAVVEEGYGAEESA